MNVLTQTPTGLFQMTEKVGLIFPILIKNNIPTLTNGIPVHNNYLGEQIALDLMRQDNFVEWAIDPWTSKINIQIV